ncbi:group II intron reverse transcriptase/maturase [Endozoicomonas sp. YOMI1]|uniref:group II intron reverse transcriptase/maturase n=1 Tax=Endozoicomonas sp. YOMI1 TaxID=2828739 RepID=UPI00359F2115
MRSCGGFSQYYSLANNAKTELAVIVDLGRLSVLKTLASKHKCSVKMISRRLWADNRRGVKAADRFYPLWTLKDLRSEKSQNSCTLR